MNSLMTLLPILLMVLLSLGSVPVLIWMERRIASMVQNRLGPNRCNIKGFRLGGLVQSIADVMKLVFKEDYAPAHIKNTFIFLLAPAIVFIASFLTFAVIPFADVITIDDKSYLFQALPTELGMLWFLALAGVSIYGIILAGWSSHNKFGMLGALRASAQMISYEIAMGLAIISMVLSYNTIYLNDMVHFQSQTLLGFIPAWGIVIQPVAALIFIVTAFAETNRAPFDVAEGESEIVAGYHTEYSAMKFGLFFVGEYLAMAASAALIVTLLLGGYNLPYISTQSMQEHPQALLITTMIVLALLFLGLLRWIFKNNRRTVVECSTREHERKVLITLFWSILIVSELILGYFLSTDLSAYTLSFITALVQVTLFTLKFFMVMTFFIVVRWTFPRFRYDQIQHLGWYILLPIALANIFITALVVML